MKPKYVVSEYPVLGSWSVMMLDATGAAYVPYSEYHVGHTKKNAEALLLCVLGYTDPAYAYAKTASEARTPRQEH